MGIILIIIGVGVWYIWANGYNKGKQDPMFARRIHDEPQGCLIPLIAFILVGGGIYLLAQ